MKKRRNLSGKNTDFRESLPAKKSSQRIFSKKWHFKGILNNWRNPFIDPFWKMYFQRVLWGRMAFKWGFSERKCNSQRKSHLLKKTMQRVSKGLQRQKTFKGFFGKNLSKRHFLKELVSKDLKWMMTIYGVIFERNPFFQSKITRNKIF